MLICMFILSVLLVYISYDIDKGLKILILLRKGSKEDIYGLKYCFIYMFLIFFCLVIFSFKWD